MEPQFDKKNVLLIGYNKILIKHYISNSLCHNCYEKKNRIDFVTLDFLVEIHAILHRI